MTETISNSIKAILFFVIATGSAAGCSSAGAEDAAAMNSGQEDIFDDRIIEESDIYKIDGTWLYVQNPHSGLNVIDVSDPEKPRLATRLGSLVGTAGELYVRDDQVFVLFESVTPACEYDETVLEMCTNMGDSCQGSDTSEVTAVMSPTTDPSIAGSYCLPGELVASRIVGDILYVVTTNSSYYTSNTWMFSIDVSDIGDMRLVDRHIMLGEGHEVHVTDSAIYLAQDGTGNSYDDTWIRYVDISDPEGTMEERGDIVVSGSPAGRFHMDEHESTFRIVTFTDPWDGTNLHIVDISNPDHLSLMGSLTNIAPEEDLHATRFMGDKAYIVTYESMILQTDPLWVISLEDPRAPKIVGHLIVPGWSDYVFPRGNQLLAVGRGDRGMKVAASLFDVSDPFSPTELRRLEFGSDSATSEANTDFRGVRIVDDGSFGDTSLMVVPVTSNIWNNGSCEPKHYLQLIDILDDDLELRGRVAEEGLIRRAVPIGNRLYAITDKLVSAVDVSDRDNPTNSSTTLVGDPYLLEECTEAPLFFDDMVDSPNYGFLPFCSVTIPGNSSSQGLLTTLVTLLTL